MKTIENPILRGFNPDPNIVRVGDDYYIATSTFEWFPGVQIHHSKDLVSWQLIGQALTTVEQLDMLGVPDSCGVWAPQISYAKGIFYLIYTSVQTFGGPWKDTPNYLVSTTNITEEWSAPTYLNSSGFDPSLFHDDDGKCYLVNMLLDHRKNKLFGGIVLQEYAIDKKQLVGKIHHIFAGTEHGCTEAPHIIKRGIYYYLVTAEGGTGYDHCITVARSRNVMGPYQVHPDNPLITARHTPTNYLQKTGHGDLFLTQTGDWYAVFLTGRPLTQRGRCITGRETAIEKITWGENDWPYTSHGSPAPRKTVPAPELAAHPFPSQPELVEFNTDSLPLGFQSLRVPMTDDWISLKKTPGYLTLVGRESLSSMHRQSLFARRVQAHHTITSTCVNFQPEHFQQMAGLVCYYNTAHYYYLHVRGGDFATDKMRRFVSIISCDKYKTTEPAGEIEIPIDGKVFLKVDYNGAALQYYYALKQDDWIAIGPVLDGSILSDDYVEQSAYQEQAFFTGAFVGIACQDLSGQSKEASFSFFKYQEPSN